MPLPIYDTSATQAAKLGSELLIGEDRVFRYAKNGPGALAVGTVLQGPRANDSHANMTCAAQSVGKNNITVTLDRGDLADHNEYAEGHIYVNDQGVTLTNEGGQGYLYEVLSHPKGEGEDTTLKITIRDHTVVALTTSSQATLIPNEYKGVSRPGGDPWDIIVGVSPVAVPTNEYFWAQVRGPCAVLQSGRLFTGRGVMLSQNKPGAVEALKQVVPVTQGRQHRQRTNDAYTTGDGGGPTAQYQQKGIEQRLGGDTQRTEDDELLTDVSGIATIPERVIGYCINNRVSTEHALIYLTLS